VINNADGIIDRFELINLYHRPSRSVSLGLATEVREYNARHTVDIPAREELFQHFRDGFLEHYYYPFIDQRSSRCHHLPPQRHSIRHHFLLKIQTV
jgi:hypothetical protein